MTEILLLSPMDVNSDGEWVEVAYEGNFIHPKDKRRFNLSKQDFTSWLEHFADNNSQIPVVKLHSMDPTDRLGTVTDMKILEAGEGDNKRPVSSIWAKVNYASEEVKTAVKAASFSIKAISDWTSSAGKTYKSILQHLGVTDYPVLKGLQKSIAASEFIFEKDAEEVSIITQLSDDSGETKEETEEETEMPFSKELLDSLGLSEGADEKAVLSAIASMKQNASRSDSLIDQKLQERLSRVDALSCEDAQKTTLKKYCTKEYVIADLDNKDSLFELTLSAFSQKKENKGFQSGNQESEEQEEEEVELSETDKIRKKAPSIVDLMKERAAS